MRRILRTWMTAAALVAALLLSPAFAEDKKDVKKSAKAADAKAADAKKTADAGAKKTTAVAGASAAEIEKAKKDGLVWVNLDSKVYHKEGRWYGKTKQGKFMTEADAKKAGYTAAKN